MERKDVYMINISNAMERYQNSRSRMIQDAIAADALLQIGRRKRIIVEKIEEYYEGLVSSQ